MKYRVLRMKKEKPMTLFSEEAAKERRGLTDRLWMRRCRRKEGSSTAACDALALFDELVISGSVDDSKVEMKEIECISLSLLEAAHPLEAAHLTLTLTLWSSLKPFITLLLQLLS